MEPTKMMTPWKEAPRVPFSGSTLNFGRVTCPLKKATISIRKGSSCNHHFSGGDLLVFRGEVVVSNQKHQRNIKSSKFGIMFARLFLFFVFSWGVIHGFHSKMGNDFCSPFFIFWNVHWNVWIYHLVFGWWFWFSPNWWIDSTLISNWGPMESKHESDNRNGTLESLFDQGFESYWIIS